MKYAAPLALFIAAIILGFGTYQGDNASVAKSQTLQDAKCTVKLATENETCLSAVTSILNSADIGNVTNQQIGQSMQPEPATDVSVMLESQELEQHGIFGLEAPEMIGELIDPNAQDIIVYPAETEVLVIGEYIDPDNEDIVYAEQSKQFIGKFIDPDTEEALGSHASEK